MNLYCEDQLTLQFLEAFIQHLNLQDKFNTISLINENLEFKNVSSIEKVIEYINFRKTQDSVFVISKNSKYDNTFKIPNGSIHEYLFNINKNRSKYDDLNRLIGYIKLLIILQEDIKTKNQRDQYMIVNKSDWSQIIDFNDESWDFNDLTLNQLSDFLKNC